LYHHIFTSLPVIGLWEKIPAFNSYPFNNPLPEQKCNENNGQKSNDNDQLSLPGFAAFGDPIGSQGSNLDNIISPTQDVVPDERETIGIVNNSTMPTFSLNTLTAVSTSVDYSQQFPIDSPDSTIDNNIFNRRRPKEQGKKVS